MATTSGVATFNLDFTEIVEEVFERCGSQSRSGYDLRTTRRSLNLMTVEWANRGLNMWTVEEIQIPLVYGQVSYALPVDTIDLLDMITRTNAATQNQQDLNINRISESTYSTIPNKLTYGRPIQVWINRQSGNINATTALVTSAVAATDTTINVSDASQIAAAGFIKLDNEIIYYPNVSGNQLVNCARGQAGTTAATHSVGTVVFSAWLPSINVWPTPDNSTPYIFVAWRMRRIQDAGTGVNIQDIPFRMLNAMIAGLSYYMSMKIPGTDPVRIAALKADYEQQYQLAADEDREKAPIRFVPRQMFYAR